MNTDGEGIKDNMTINDLAVMMADGFSGMEQRLGSQISEIKSDVSTLKSDVSTLKSDVSVLKTDVDQIKNDLQDFKSETRERFDKLEDHLKENEESIDAIVKDYHPRIISLEEKVFGHATLADS